MPKVMYIASLFTIIQKNNYLFSDSNSVARYNHMKINSHYFALDLFACCKYVCTIASYSTKVCWRNTMMNKNL